MSELRKSAGVVIVGGGVIGLTVARALVLRGLSDVLLIERSSLGAESSSAAAGMLAPQAEANLADDFFISRVRVETCTPPSPQPCSRKQA